MSALIDTGSDKTLSYLKPFGEALGVDIDEFEGEPEDIQGLCGGTTAWAKHMDLWINGNYLNVPIFWLNDVFKLESDYQMILGRKIIFTYFDVVFCEAEKKIYFYKR